VAWRAEYFARVTTGRELVGQLTDEAIHLSRREAISRLSGVVIGPDGEQSCAVVTLADTPKRDLHAILDELRDVAQGVGIDEPDVHLGGPPVVNAAIDRSSTQSLIRQAGTAGLVGLFVAALLSHGTHDRDCVHCRDVQRRAQPRGSCRWRVCR
jgi:hypothetical protein